MWRDDEYYEGLTMPEKKLIRREDLTRDGVSLLLYLETRVVDHAGRVADEKMNNEDRAMARDWHDAGFIEFGRIAMKHASVTAGNSWVVLSPEAWEMAHALRRERAAKMWAKRDFATTADKKSRNVTE